MSQDLPAWWLKTPEDWRTELRVPAGGLSSAQAAAQRLRFGPNRVHAGRIRPLVVQLAARFKNPLVLILLAASVISAQLGETASSIIVSLMVLLSVTLDFVQEYRAGRAAEKLRQTVQVRALAVRDGAPRDVPAADIVPGDEVELSAGDLVPADAILLSACDFYVNQALLTGEPYPLEKRPDMPADPEPDLPDASNAVFMGTSVVSGNARALVVYTGKDTHFAGIAASIGREPPPTSFEIGTRRFGALIMQITVLLVLFVLLANLMFHRPWLESFLFSVALAVGLTPELLPMIVSVTLARGAMRMASKRVIVKRMAAIQNLGSMDVLCTDKTGTLTEAKIVLERSVDCQGTDAPDVLRLAYINSSFETGLKNPLDQAILAHTPHDIAGWRKVDEVPFDFQRRRVSVLADGDGSRFLIVKGAAEEVVRLCTGGDTAAGGGLRSSGELALAGAGDLYRAYEEQGFRVLGVARREMPPGHAHVSPADESNLTLAGFLLFRDPPKRDARAALEALHDSGVSIKIVTGDSDRVTRHLCPALGLAVTGVLTGKEIAAMDDRALRAAAGPANLFCRVTPTQKERIIRALKARSHVVGFLGDGINDAPPLHTADVGLSVDSAVDVAKEAADIILLDRDLAVLHDGVVEGRRTFANIMKYIMMATSSNFGNMFSMAGAALFLPFLPMLPTQILLNNFLYDVSEIPIPLDRVDPDELREPRVLQPGFIRRFMLTIGPVSSVFDFLTFYVLLSVLHADASMFQTGWFVESLCTQVLVIFVIRCRGSALAGRPSRVLAATSLGVVLLGALLPLTPLGDAFGFVPLPLRFFVILLGMVLAYLVLVEAIKQVFYRRYAALP